MGVIWQRIPLPLSSDHLSISKNNQNFSDLRPDILRVTSQTSHLVAFLFNSFICLIQGSSVGCGLPSSLKDRLKIFFLPALFVPCRALYSLSQQVTVLRTPRACSDLAFPSTVITLPRGYHSLEGRFVAMERKRLVSKTRPTWRDLKKKSVGCLFTHTCQLALQSFIKIITVKKNQHKNVVNKQDIKQIKTKNSTGEKYIQISIEDSLITVPSIPLHLSKIKMNHSRKSLASFFTFFPQGIFCCCEVYETYTK